MENKEHKQFSIDLPRGFFRAVGTVALVIGMGVGAAHADDIPVVRDLVQTQQTVDYDLFNE